MNAATGFLLIVDDDENLRDIMSRRLERKGYRTAVAENGTRAFEFIKSNSVDLVLLDIMMPKIDGMEVLRILRRTYTRTELPIIMVSARDESPGIVEGLTLGANDYVVKPVDFPVALARIQTHLALKVSEENLRDANDLLQKRYEELEQLEVMRTSLTQMIVHDLRNPLAAVKGFLELMQMRGYVSEEKTAQQCLRAIQTSTQTLLDMINAMLDLASLEEGKMILQKSPVEIGELLSEIELGMRPLMEREELTLVKNIPEGFPSVFADPECLRRILVNIIGNAIRFSPRKGTISTTAKVEKGRVRFAVRDQGCGIPFEYQKRIFEKFGQVEDSLKGGKYTTGLGLAFCKLAVQAHNGEIGVESSAGEGAAFWFTLPLL